MIKQLTLLAALSICFLNIDGQISGEGSVNFGDTESYTEPITGNPGTSYYIWKIIGGTENLGTTETEVSVTWDEYITTGRVEKWVIVPSYGVETRIASKDIYIDNFPVIKYEYDQAGNRTNRNMIILHSSELKSAKISNEDNFNEKYIDNINDLKVTIFPNPTDGILNINIEGLEESLNSSINIYNSKGMMIRKSKILGTNNKIDLSAETSGIYIIVIFANNVYSQWKIIKQ